MDLARELHAFEARHDYDALIDTLRARIADNPRTVTDPAVKAWMARRWRRRFSWRCRTEAQPYWRAHTMES